MALPANALTIVATVKDELGIGDGDNSADSVLERLIGVASDLIEKTCRRNFLRATVTSERVPGFGTPRLLVARTPLLSITSIVQDGTTISASDYYLEDADAGSIFRVGGYWDWTQPLAGQRGYVPDEGDYRVTYVGGYYLPSDTTNRNLPYPIEQACIISVVSQFRARGKYQRLVNETAEGAIRPWYDYALPRNAELLIEPYRRVTL